MIEEELSNLTVNHLTEEQYMNAKANGDINENELYMTPDDGNYGEGGIIVSPTEPTADRRKVWFQKGKNYINENLLKIETVNGVTCSIVDGKIVFNGTATNNGCFRIPIFLKKGMYVFSWYGKHIASHFTFRAKNNNYISDLELPGGINNILTVTTDDEYIIGLNINKDKVYTASNTSFNIQLEQGTEATEYEEYINSAIYAKNNNGEYEKFIEKEEERIDITTEMEYATNEYIDGNRVYRKRMLLGYGPNNSSPKAYPIGVQGFNIVKTDLYLKQNALCIPLPLISADTAAIVNYYIDGTNLIIQAGRDRSGFLVRAEIYYIK